MWAILGVWLNKKERTQGLFISSFDEYFLAPLLGWMPGKMGWADWTRVLWHRSNRGNSVCVCVCVCVVGGEGVGRKFEKEIKIQMHWPGLIRRLPTECRPWRWSHRGKERISSKWGYKRRSVSGVEWSQVELGETKKEMTTGLASLWTLAQSFPCPISFSKNFLTNILFIYYFGCTGSWSWCSWGFSCCRTWALEHGISICNMWAWLPRGVWDLSSLTREVPPFPILPAPNPSSLDSEPEP